MSSANPYAERRLLQIAIDGNTKAIFVLIEAFLDESGTGSSDLAHCLAGYILKPDHGLKMERKWKAVLDRYKIPFFHMTDCAAYQKCEPYKSMGREKCINLACDLIWLIKVHCLQGFGVCFNPRDYNLYQLGMVGTQNPYSYSVNTAHIHITNFIRTKKYKNVDLSYVLEAGYKDQKCASAVLDKILSTAQEKDHFRYKFHTKRSAVLLQAADILAWHCSQYIRKRIEGKAARLDFQSLVEIPHQIFHFSNTVVDGIKQPANTAISIDFSPAIASPEMEERFRQTYKAGGIVP